MVGAARARATGASSGDAAQQEMEREEHGDALVEAEKRTAGVRAARGAGRRLRRGSVAAGLRRGRPERRVEQGFAVERGFWGKVDKFSAARTLNGAKRAFSPGSCYEPRLKCL